MRCNSEAEKLSRLSEIGDRLVQKLTTTIEADNFEVKTVNLGKSSVESELLEMREGGRGQDWGVDF